MRHRFSFFILLFVFSAANAQTRIAGPQVTKTTVSNVPTHKSSSRSITSLEYSLNAVLWQQRSGEYQALCYQAFSFAKFRLQEKIALRKSGGEKLAIVTDIDETVLDNSPQQATDILHHTTYTEKSWLNWTSHAEASDIPGAVAFFQWADKMGIQCFYVSNRSAQERDATIKNLLLRGFPQADTLHVIMKDTSSDKEPRREKIRQQYTIALLLGDNLNDFDKMFYKQSWFIRSNLVRDNKDLFGDIFIILPNPVYGDWESAIWEYKNITPAEAEKTKHDALYTY
ncbi:MAG: 5'-nucleotidase, lipoprotein e(P4) family [Ferruginibacter sp.]